MVRDRCEEMRLYMRNKRARFAAAGVCRTCGGPIEESQFKKCAKCRMGNWQATKVYRETDSYRDHSSRALKNWDLQKKYGITLADYLRMLKEQNGACKICLGVDAHKALAVDHDHQTKVVRGLLCDRCNRGLRHFKDSPAYLQLAIDYLRSAGK